MENQPLLATLRRRFHRETGILFLTRFLRMWNYGAIAPIFFLYCLEIGLSSVRTGVLISSILVGDMFVTLYLTTWADEIGRRKTLIVGSILKVGAGVSFALTKNFAVLIAVGVLGVISTSGGETGPFMSIEQACLTEARGTNINIAVLYGWYNAVGYCAQALGALASGLAVHLLKTKGDWSDLEAFRAVFFSYSCVGGILALLYLCLRPGVEVPYKLLPEEHSLEVKRRWAGRLSLLLPRLSLGLRRRESKYIVLRLSVLFAMDAFGGAFVMQTWISLWFHERWGFTPNLIGYLLMCANIVAGASGVAAAYFVTRFGAMNTMVVSHLPSNILLGLVPLMPSKLSAAFILVARFCISQMDVPARQAYVAMVVDSDERSAAGGITNIVRSLGMSAAPSLLGYLTSYPKTTIWFSAPWEIAAIIKILYDVILYTLYRTNKAIRENISKAAKTQVPLNEDINIPRLI